jgi:hypothetical protein
MKKSDVTVYSSLYVKQLMTINLRVTSWSVLQTMECVRLALRVSLECWSPGILDHVKASVFFIYFIFSGASKGRKLVLHV